MLSSISADFYEDYFLSPSKDTKILLRLITYVRQFLEISDFLKILNCFFFQTCSFIIPSNFCNLITKKPCNEPISYV